MTTWEPGSVVGDFELLGEHARGGLGRILRAKDRRLDRVVAIKIPRAELGADGARRLAHEARLTAQLQHPAIMPVYAEGLTDDGEPYFAMKLVEGSTLAELIERGETLDQRLPLVTNVRAVVRAIAHAHEHGVLHRDVKPANVLVGAFGETVVADWGLGVRIDEASPGVVGTPAFMAPEQRDGKPATPRSDVYALGATLYAVLAGHSPHDRSGSRDVRTIEPGAPSDLAAIVARAMAGNPAQRYDSAGALGLDLDRFLTGRLVSVRRYAPGTRLARWARRNPGTVGLTAGLLTAVVVTGVVSARQVAGERDEARRWSSQAVVAAARNALDRDPTESVAWLVRAPLDAEDREEAARIRTEADRRGVAEAVFRYSRSALDLEYSPDGRRLAVAGSDGLTHIHGADGVTLLRGHGTWVDRIAFATNSRLVSGDRDTRIGVWDLDQRAGRIAGEPRSSFRTWGLAIGSGGGDAVLTSDAGLIWWRLDSLVGEPLERIIGGTQRLASSTSGDVLLTSGWKGVVARWDRAAGRPQPTLIGQVDARPSVALSPSARWAVAASGQKVTVWELPGAAPRELSLPSRANAVALSSDERRLAVGMEDGVQLIDVTTGESLTFARGMTDVFAIEFSHDGRHLAAAGTRLDRDTYVVVVRDIERGTTRELLGHGQVNALAWSPDGARIAAASGDRQVRVWPVVTARVGGDELTTARFTNDGVLASPFVVVGEIQAAVTIRVRGPGATAASP